MGVFTWLQHFRQSLGVNRTVLALSMARLADGIGNSILFIILPLYVVQLPQAGIDFPLPLLIGVLISAFGFANSELQLGRPSFFSRRLLAGISAGRIVTSGNCGTLEVTMKRKRGQ